MAWKRLAMATGLICLMGWGRLSSPQPGLAQSLPDPVVESTPSGLSLVWTPPAYTLTPVEVDGRPYSRLQMPSTTLSGRPGRPQLPLYSTLIGLPPAGNARLRVVEVERDIVALPDPPLPAPVPQPVSAAGGSALPTEGPTSRAPDPEIYSQNAFYPAAIAELGPVQQLRHLRVAPLVVYPLRANPVTGQMEVIRYLRLEVEFDQPAPETGGQLSAQAQSGPFGRAAASILANPEAAGWVAAPALAAESGPQTAAAAPAETKIVVNRAGLYAVTYNQLLNAGLPVAALDPRTLQLHHGWPRQEVAIVVEGESDGVFNPGDRLLFYAEPEASRFVDNDVYFLTYGQTAGLRMGLQTANPAGLPAGVAWRTTVAETNSQYDPHYAGRDGDHWFWADLRRPGAASGAYTIRLSSPQTGGPNATLTLWLQSYTDPAPNPDHRLAVSVNAAAVGEHTWNGVQAVEAGFAVPAAGLKDGTNQVELSLPGLGGVSIEGLWLDAIRLVYPTTQGGPEQLAFTGEAGPKSYTLGGWTEAGLSVYNITDPTRPVRLTGYTVTPAGAAYTLSLGDAAATPARYLVVPNSQIAAPVSVSAAQTLVDPPAGADYIIITHPNFAQAITPLVQHRASQGLRVVTVNIQAIYDTYGEGRMDPAAIKNFLQHAFNTWTPPAPTYVLLVGDGSYDFKNYSGYNPQTFIPPYLADVDPWWGETAADNRFVTLSGGDLLPEMLIGRLAVTTEAEVSVVVNKIIQYETSPPAGGWNARHLFVADNPDSAGNFPADADSGYGRVQAPYTGQRFYYNSAAANPYEYASIDALRANFLNSFNQGAGVVTFHGHSSWLQWAEEGALRYYPAPYAGPNDLAGMVNGSRLPVVLEMTCFTGSFHRPEVDTLDESLLNISSGGAVAVWGSTGLGIGTGHVSLQAGFYEALNQGESNLGAAVLAGKMALNSTGFYRDLLDTFTLFGDPALAINLNITPYSGNVYLPVIYR